ncbi:hypothetical protein VKS41_002006 [Umbelopsis sp. WA50703]
MSASDLSEYLKFATDLAKQAGGLIKEGVDKRFAGAGSIMAKYSNPSDMVTETDQAVEAFIKEKISKAYPNHKFIGEETFAAGEKPSFTEEPTWIVDPIDGTTNFIHGYPFVCVSIGLTINKMPVVGVIYNPLLNELYTAAHGQGAYLNQTTRLPLFDPKNIAPLKDLSECLVMTEMGADRTAAVISRKIDTIHNLVASPQDPGKRSIIQNSAGSQAHSIRSTGSAALNLCCVAKGVADVFWEIGCWEWDVCAAIVVLREAGGITLDGLVPDEKEVNIFCRRYLAIRPTGDRESQLKIARQFWSVVPKEGIDAPRDAVPGGYEP